MHTGLTVITGTEDRPHAYVALTRGTTINIAYVFAVAPKRADPPPASPAPNFDRYDRHTTSPGTQPVPATGPEDALAVLSGVLARDGQLLSATQTRNQALAGADHLAILNAISAPSGRIAFRIARWSARARAWLRVWVADSSWPSRASTPDSTASASWWRGRAGCRWWWRS